MRILFITAPGYEGAPQAPLQYDARFNTGDTVYFFPIMSYFDCKENEISYMTVDEVYSSLCNHSEIGKHYDIAIHPHANIFSSSWQNEMKRCAWIYQHLGIPVYVLGAGCDAGLTYNVDALEPMESVVKEFVDAVMNHGGEITLRGYFTQAALEQIGIKGLFVSGCPSIYKSGENLSINKMAVSRSAFCPLFHGGRISDIPLRWYRQYPKARFFDQDRYLAMLYHPEEAILYRWDFLYPAKEIFREDRVRGDVNYVMWKRQIFEGGYHLAFGARIHGNIIALQNGLPAFLDTEGSRTREIAEFYDIPNSYALLFNRDEDDLYDLYCELSFDTFKKTYKKRYLSFKKWLDRRIPNCLGNNADFFKELESLNYYDYRNNKNIKKRRDDYIRRMPGKWRSVILLAGKRLENEIKSLIR